VLRRACRELKALRAIQWLGDYGPQYAATATALLADALGLVPITTLGVQPGTARSATRRRSWTQLGAWFGDYNIQAPYSALGMRSPTDYRAGVTLSSSL